MEFDSQNPYEINEEAPLDYTFINRDGIKYHASFYSVEPLYPEFIETYYSFKEIWSCKIRRG